MQNSRYKYAILICEKNIQRLQHFHISATSEHIQDGMIILNQHSYKHTCSTKLAAGECHCPVLAIGYWRWEHL